MDACFIYGNTKRLNETKPNKYEKIQEKESKRIKRNDKLIET